jgi:hypothetical protein
MSVHNVLSTVALSFAFLSAAVAEEASGDYENLEFAETMEVGKEYQIGDTGMRGILGTDHILVTTVEPGSAADGKVLKGDLLKAFQYYGIGPDFGATVKKRLYRLGRDWHYRFTIALDRPTSRAGKGNRLIVHLQLPPRPGLQHHFGPTGFFAKLYPDYLEVDHVDEGSPSDGKLQLGDHILKVDGKAVDSGVFELFTRSIDRAESKKGAGKLPLTVRRSGADGAADETVDVVLPLKVLGDYDPMSPFTGEKADALVTHIADAMIRDKAYGRLNVGLLGLLATGEKTYIEHVGNVLKESKFAAPDVKVPIDGSVQTWYTSYRTLIMCEYHLLTGDTSVLPAIKTHAVMIARGQDAAGLWNHRFANPANNLGKLHGRLNGYGALNQTSMTQWMAMIMAEKCGVEDRDVRAAIEKTHAQFRRYVHRGALPYGNHAAMEQTFNNNGTSASAAVAFALLGDQEAARFFSRMSAAGHNEILTGHTGPFFNIMWSGLGANVCGPDVTTAFNRELHWLRTIARTWNGRCVGIVAWGTKPKNENIGCTGSELLNACVGRRAIYITGRDADKSLWLRGKAAKEAVDAWRNRSLSTRALLKDLGSPLSPVRVHAAELLAVADADVNADVLRLLKTGSREERIGALDTIRCLKIESAVEHLMRVIRDEQDEVWLRVIAIRALSVLDGGKAVSDELLRLITVDRPSDRFDEIDLALGQAVVKMAVDPYEGSPHRDVFYAAIMELLNHKHAYGRQAGMSLLRNIPIEEFPRVAEKMMVVIKDEDRGTYTSYHYDAHRQTGLEIMYRLGIDESIDLAVDTIHEKVGRVGLRRRGRTQLMSQFGAEAKRIVPRIKEVLGKEADPIVERIETSKTARKMISFEEARAVGK